VPLNFNVSGAARGVYETGLLQSVQTDGTVVTTDALSASLTGDAYGAKVWQHSGIGLDYRADYRYSNQYTQLNGLLQALSFEYYNQLKRRLTLSARTVAGTSNRAFGSFVTPALTGSQDFGVPTNELFDSRFYYFQQNVTLSYQRSARTRYFSECTS
jgi:hypothetical protein